MDPPRDGFLSEENACSAHGTERWFLTNKSWEWQGDHSISSLDLVAPVRPVRHKQANVCLINFESGTLLVISSVHKIYKMPWPNWWFCHSKRHYKSLGISWMGSCRVELAFCVSVPQIYHFTRSPNYWEMAKAYLKYWCYTLIQLQEYPIPAAACASQKPLHGNISGNQGWVFHYLMQPCVGHTS